MVCFFIFISPLHLYLKLYEGKEKAIDDRTHVQNQRFIEMKIFNIKKKEEREQYQKR